MEEFQPLCEVQSDKATIEITSRFKGKVALLSHSPGDIIKVRPSQIFKTHTLAYDRLDFSISTYMHSK